jgi:steroid 5-alpha reductase family enzyme
MAASGSSPSRQGVVNPLRTPSSDFPLSPLDVGLFKSTILPSFALHSGLSAASYIVARATDIVEIKDWMWPLAPVINAWWSSVGRAICYSDISLGTVWESFSWSEKLLLSGVTTWGLRLFYRVASRTITRGKDDPRYEQDNKQPNFWNKAFFTHFLPEILFQTAITLPFTVPFRVVDRAVSLHPDAQNVLRGVAVGLFNAGLTLETLADFQLSSYTKVHDDLCREGVWSVVRHPK